MILVFHKPFGVLSQFTPDGSTHQTLASFGLPSQVYPVGRLDADSEGMLILSDERRVPSRLLEPERGHPREYWAQVEREPDAATLAALAGGLEIKTGRTLPCRAWTMAPPELPPREPPIRFRKTVATAWIGLELVEGKNRQVRRMTAAVGHPTLRLYRARIGGLALGQLGRGAWRELSAAERDALLSKAT